MVCVPEQETPPSSTDTSVLPHETRGLASPFYEMAEAVLDERLLFLSKAQETVLLISLLCCCMLFLAKPKSCVTSFTLISVITGFQDRSNSYLGCQPSTAPLLTFQALLCAAGGIQEQAR